MKQEDGKYIVDLGLKWVDDKIVMPNFKEEVLKEDIEKMLHEGFSFMEGVFSSDKPSHGVWQQRKFLGSNTIRCEVVREHQDYRTPDGMATWYWTYHISIWYTVGKFLGISLGNAEELDAICRNIAQMIEDKYEVKDRATRDHIPVMLREKLGEDFEPKNVLGYRYSAGYWEEDESSWDCTIRDFIEEPVIQVYVANDKNDLLISIEKKDLLQDSYADFENLHQWLKDKYGKGNTSKTDGVFGIVKEFGKYQVEFGRFLKFSNHCFSKKLMNKSISKLLPIGFEYIGDVKDWKWHWVQHHAKEVKANIFCEISLGYDESNQMYNHFDIWHETDNTSVLTRELDIVCLNIARMIAAEYPNDMYEHVGVLARYVDIGDMTEIAHVEFDVPLNKDETEKLRCLLFTSECFYPDNLRWQDRELYHRIEKKGEKLLEATFGPQPLARVGLHWAEGERDRLIYGCTALTDDGILRMVSYLKEVGNATPSRKELLGRAGASFVWKEVWTRETGHMWENYTLLKRVPSEEELDYADCSQYAVLLKDLSTETIVKLLNEYKV